MDPKQFSPLPWQLQPWKDTRKTVVIAGGAGSGKSALAQHKLNALCLRFPNALGIVVRKYAESLKNSVIPAMESIVGPRVVHVPSKSRFEYPNGSKIVYGGMKDEKQRQKLRSVGNVTSGADFALMEESNAFTSDDFDELSARMRGQAAPFTQIILCTNPDAERHWINQRFIRPSTSGQIANVGIYQPRPEDNPTLRADYFERLDALTGVMKLRMRYGKWANAEGAIYGEVWDPARAIIDAFPIPKDWRRIRAVDFGFVNPRVVLWIAIDPDGGMYVYRQTYQTGQTASESAKEIIRLSKDDGSFEATICDHDADERAEMEHAGISTIGANKQVVRGIQLVEQRLKDGRIKFFRGCLVREQHELRSAFKPCSTEEEFEVYNWKRGADGSIVKEEPEKKNDHGMDALRYATMYEDRDLIDPAGDDMDALESAVQHARMEMGDGSRHRLSRGGGGEGHRSRRWMP